MSQIGFHLPKEGNYSRITSVDIHILRSVDKITEELKKVARDVEEACHPIFGKMFLWLCQLNQIDDDFEGDNDDDFEGDNDDN